MDTIRFHLNDRLVEERTAPPTTTLLRYLRDHLRLTGTKEGCAEGDCGACTVAILDPDAHGGPAWRAVNACLVPLPAVHGRRVVTVEGLARDGAPHPAQESLVQELGSQCGYCTPGVVMSMFEATYRPDMDAPWKLDDQMCGNLCRCTGYRPIRDAARRVAGLRPDDAFAARLAEPRGDLALSYTAGDQTWLAPTTIDGIVEALAAGDARIVCGATDLGLDVTKKHARFPRLVTVEAAPELRRIGHANGVWSFGAAAPLADVEAATDRDLPSLARMLRFFGSRQIKNRATLGGNLGNASPIGDTPPILIALGARVVLRSAAGERTLDLADFFTGYRKTALSPGELLVRVEVPDPPPDARIGAYKVSKRRELDISAVAAGMMVRVGPDGHVVEARLAYGGMAATPRRAAAAEAALLGLPWGPAEAIESAVAALGQDFVPISDHRGSAWYRATVAANLLRGFLEETRDAAERRLPDRPTATVQCEVSP